MATRQLLKHLSSSFLDEDKFHSVYSNAVAAGTVAQSPKVVKVFGGRFRRGKDAAKRTVKSKSEQQHQPFLSFIVVYTMIFFNGCCFTAVVPSVPFYLEILSAPPSFLGWVVSFYSLGQIIGSPSGGYLADKVSSKLLLTTSSTIGFLSSVVYSLAPVYTFVLLARLLTGISAGMEFATELAFISKNTTKTERTIYLASVTAVNVVGFILGPALAGLISTLDITLFGTFQVDKYTGPGWLLAIMFVVDIVLVQCFFEDQELPKNRKTIVVAPPVATQGQEEKPLLKENFKMSYGGVEEDEEDDHNNKDLEEAEADHGEEDNSFQQLVKSLRESQRPPATVLVLGLIFVQFTVMCAWSVLETITSPLASDNFGWDVQDCNLLFTAGGGVSLIAYVGFVVVSKWVEDRWLIVYALCVCILGQMLAIDWEVLETTWIPESVLALLPSTYRNRFIAGYLIMNVGFMTGRPVTFALYSKLIGSEYQGKYLGFMVAGGSAARTLGPFAAVAVYYKIKEAGVNLLVLFGSVGVFHWVCLVLIINLWRRLLPSKSLILSTRILTSLEEREKKIGNQNEATTVDAN